MISLPETLSVYIEIPRNKRILVTGDIHGHLSHLTNALKKAHFSNDDILIIVCDIVEKGPESLKTLRYIMELRERRNVFLVIGNVDAKRLHLINEISEESVGGFYDYLVMLRRLFGISFYDELVNELGYKCNGPKDILASKNDIIKHFKPEFDFLSGLPTIIETQKYIFVHGGLPDKDIADNSRRKLFELTKYDEFMNTEHSFDKYVVVGHWPVCLYGEESMQCNPIIDSERKIISIDGGCGIKEYGQLNVLIIPEINCSIDEVSYESYDEMPVFHAMTAQKESVNPTNIRWTNNKIKILQREDEFSYIKHISSGRNLWVPNSYLLDDTSCKDFTDYVLPVSPGDKLSLRKKTSNGYIVKKDGVFGWYFGELGEI